MNSTQPKTLKFVRDRIRAQRYLTIINLVISLIALFLAYRNRPQAFTFDPAEIQRRTIELLRRFHADDLQVR